MISNRNVCALFVQIKNTTGGLVWSHAALKAISSFLSSSKIIPVPLAELKTGFIHSCFKAETRIRILRGKNIPI